MRAAIYNPYWDTLGGGERYCITFAKVLLDAGYKVDIQWKKENIINRLEERFGIKLNDLRVVDSVKKGDGYDVCFWLSDGSIPLLHARNNVLHFQIPFKNVNGKTLINKMKMYRINSVVVNSYFTKKFIDKEYGIDSVVLYPPVDVESIKSVRKQNIILFVGRFSQLKQAKKQDVLVSVFKKMVDNGLRGWKLILAGGIEVGAGDYLKKLESMIDNYPVEIVKSPDYQTLTKLYGKSKIFWSASGYGVDERRHPDKVEHFGISVVEAMAAGCVPVVYSAGGYKEIVNKESGVLWKTRNSLITKTISVIKDKYLYLNLVKNSKERSNYFSMSVFKEKIINEII